MQNYIALWYKLVLVIVLIIPARLGTLAQSAPNLVKNPGFEDYKECPRSHNPENQSHKIIPGWTYPSFAAPDYFNRCSPSNPDGVSVPRNFAGISQPKAGNGYVGAILSGTSESRREYLQGEFEKPLEAGKQYCVTFYYRLASGSRFAVDQISVYFSDRQILTEGKEAIGVKPQLSNIDGLFLDNVEDWEQMCRIYTAAGGEKYFLIGNFKNYQNTNYVVTDKNVVNERNKAYAYYYFDEVVIRELANCSDCPCVQHDFEARIVDTTFTGGLNPITGRVDRIVNDGYIKVAVAGGSPPYQVSWSNGYKGMEIRNLPAGTYKFVATDKFNCRAEGSVTFIAPKIIKDEFAEGLKNIEEGSAIVLENIFFEFNKTDLLPESYAELNKVADFMLQERITKIEISGHTDSEGSEAYNQKLSEGRAMAVVEYIIRQGVPASSLAAVGYGEAKPIDTNATEEGRAINRRVEFLLVKK